MAESFQNEIPKARINIALDVEIEGARKKKELPLKLLILGDFSNSKTRKVIAERERIPVNKNNFEKILKELNPTLEYSVSNKITNNGTDLKICLSLDSMKSFHPENIVTQISELQKLLAMRNLLKELKANIVDNSALRHTLENITKDKSHLKLLQNELQISEKNP